MWLALGLIGAGFDNAYFQRKWSNQCNGQRDHLQSMIVVPFGPINLFVSFLLSGYGKYGWSLAIHANPKCINVSEWK